MIFHTENTKLAESPGDAMDRAVNFVDTERKIMDQEASAGKDQTVFCPKPAQRKKSRNEA